MQEYKTNDQNDNNAAILEGEGAQEETVTKEEVKAENKELEPVAIILRRSIVFLTNKIIFVEIVYTAVLILVSLPVFMLDLEPTFRFGAYLVAGILLFILAGIKIGLYIWLSRSWVKEYYTISDREIAYINGLEEKVISLQKVDQVSFKQSRLGKILNYGDITIVTSTTDQNFVLSEIPNPYKYCEIIRNHSPMLGKSGSGNGEDL